jgi:hypothetical protein
MHKVPIFPIKWLQVTSSIRVFCFKPNPICCTGIDHQKVTQTFAPAGNYLPNPYGFIL